MNPQPKQKNIVDKAYREWLRKQPCCVCGMVNGVVVAHQRHKSDANGFNVTPSDTYALPLCNYCHIGNQHQTGEVSFWADHGLNKFELMVNYLTRYRKEAA